LRPKDSSSAPVLMTAFELILTNRLIGLRHACRWGEGEKKGEKKRGGRTLHHEVSPSNYTNRKGKRQKTLPLFVYITL